MNVALKLEGAAGEKVTELIDEYGEFRVQEALTRLELALEDEGWNRLGAQSQYDFSRTGLKKIIEIARAMFLANPLINHGVMVQADYVWAQGVNITPKAQLLAPVINAFLDHRGNKREFTGHQARILKEIAAQTDGNIFFALFTDPSTGAVRLRSVPVDQVDQIVKNPEDDHEPWYYLRQWTPADPKNPAQIGSTKKAYYPDWLYRPKYKPSKVNDIDVMWNSPIYHIKVGCTDNMSFGVPEVYAALDWARAVVQSLEDYATIRRAHARFAWRFTTKAGPKGVAAAKAKLGTTLSTDANETNPAPVTGSTFIAAEGNLMEPIKTSGSAAPPDEARRMWLMVGSGLGIPETMLSGDATVGNYATAKSLDRPTELKMKDRQTLWSEVFGDILGYVVDQAALKPNGPLKGKALANPYTGEVSVQVIHPESKQPIDRRIDIDFPPILLRDIHDRIDAIVSAYTSNGFQAGGLMDLRTAMRMILVTLGEDDVDETLASLLPPNNPNPPINPDAPGEPTAPANDDPSSSVAPATPVDVTVPDPGGPVDSPSAANSTM